METCSDRQGNGRRSTVFPRGRSILSPEAGAGLAARALGLAFRVLLLCLVLLGSGCAGRRPGLEPGVLEPTAGPPLAAAVADSLASRVRQEAARFHSLRASAELFVRPTPDASPRKLLLALVARRPDQARIRARFGLLATVFDLNAAGDSLELYLPREGLFVSGPLSTWTHTPFPGAEWLVEIILPSPLPGTASDPGCWRRTPTGWEVALTDSTGACRRLTYDLKGLRLVRQQFLMPPGSIRSDVDVVYGRHRQSGGLWFPESIRVAGSRRPERCELRFSSSALNAELSPDLFRIGASSEARRVAPDEVEWRLAEAAEGGE